MVSGTDGEQRPLAAEAGARPLDLPEESGRGADGCKKGPLTYSAALRS